MTAEEALKFLEAHQTMPDDKELSQELIDQYELIRKYFLKQPDDRCISLFLNSFGEGDGFGVYQRVEDVIRLFPPWKVVPDLIKSLASSRRSVRYWSAEIASIFPDKALVDPLGRLLDEADEDMRAAAAIALGQIKEKSARRLLVERLLKEQDKHVRSIIEKELKKL
jgi:HEAT repeat protein